MFDGVTAKLDSLAAAAKAVEDDFSAAYRMVDDIEEKQREARLHAFDTKLTAKLDMLQRRIDKAMGPLVPSAAAQLYTWRSTRRASLGGTDAGAGAHDGDGPLDKELLAQQEATARAVRKAQAAAGARRRRADANTTARLYSQPAGTVRDSAGSGMHRPADGTAEYGAIDADSRSLEDVLLEVSRLRKTVKLRKANAAYRQHKV